MEYGSEVGKPQAGPLIKKLLMATVQVRADRDIRAQGQNSKDQAEETKTERF